MIETLILDAGKHARDMAQIPRLTQADRAKFSRKEISTIVHDNVLLGRLNTCEALLKNHKLNPYKDIDELIGDLQILLVKSNDDLRRMNPQHRVTFTVDDLIEVPSAPVS